MFKKFEIKKIRKISSCIECYVFKFLAILFWKWDWKCTCDIHINLKCVVIVHFENDFLVNISCMVIVTPYFWRVVSLLCLTRLADMWSTKWSSYLIWRHTYYIVCWFCYMILSFHGRVFYLKQMIPYVFIS